MKKNALKEPPKANKAPDITLVLNGGKDELDSATIPVQWFFSKELAENTPTHLILIDKTGGQFASQNKGRRYLVRVDQAVFFLQLHRSGPHRLSILAFNNYEKAVSHLLKCDGNYKEAIDDQLIEVADAHNGALAGTSIEFTIPAEFFAQEPKSPIGKFFFWYLKWPNRKANDECSVRRAAIFALPKLPFFVAWWLLKFVGFILFLLYMLIAPGCAWFFGYQPICPTEWWERIKDAFLYTDIDLNIYAGGQQYQRYHGYKKLGYYEEGKKMWFSPMDITLYLLLLSIMGFIATKMFFIGAYMIGFLLVLAIFVAIVNAHSERLIKGWKKNNHWITCTLVYLGLSWILSLIFTVINGIPAKDGPIANDFIFLGLIVVTCAVLIVAIAFMKVVRSKKSTSKTEEKKPDPALAYRHYLLRHFTRPKNKVDLKQLPETFSSSQKARNFRVSFWTLKAKVCRPYEQ